MTQPVRRSKRHIEILGTLRRLFGATRIKEEHPIKIDGRTLFLDIYLPTLKLAFEIQGKQHYEFSPYMHASRAAFRQQRENDGRKKEWCGDNGVKLCLVGLNTETSPASVLALIKGGDTHE
jgi:hypothetical protein